MQMIFMCIYCSGYTQPNGSATAGRRAPYSVVEEDACENMARDGMLVPLAAN